MKLLPLRGWSGRMLFVSLALSLAACGGPAVPDSPDVWAVVDGRAIMKADVEKAYRAMVQPSDTPVPDEERLATYLNVLDELIVQDILAARARATGLQVLESEIDTAFAERRGELTDAEMTDQLSRRSLTRDDVRAVLRRELLVDKLLERDIVSKIVVTDEEVTRFFDANRDRFNLRETQYRIAQIVVTPERDAQITNRRSDDATSPEAARRKIEMLSEKLRGGADFAELAADYSEDPQSAPQGGDLGFIPESALKQVPPELAGMVRKMEPGNVNSLAMGGGYTMVLLVAREPAGQRDLSTPGVRENIREGLRDRRDTLLRTAYLAEARHGATVDPRLARAVVAGQGQPPAGLLTGTGR